MCALWETLSIRANIQRQRIRKDVCRYLKSILAGVATSRACSNQGDDL